VSAWKRVLQFRALELLLEQGGKGQDRCAGGDEKEPIARTSKPEQGHEDQEPQEQGGRAADLHDVVRSTVENRAARSFLVAVKELPDRRVPAEDVAMARA
jgi:hypothetical protein